MLERDAQVRPSPSHVRSYGKRCLKIAKIAQYIFFAQPIPVFYSYRKLSAEI